MDGQPLKNALVRFVPEHARESVGLTDDQGQYELRLNERLKGAAVGRHKVLIASNEDKREVIPARYNLSSELTAEVKEGENPPINFELNSKSSSVKSKPTSRRPLP